MMPIKGRGFINQGSGLLALLLASRRGVAGPACAAGPESKGAAIG